MRFLLGTELQHRPREVAFLTATCKCYPCQIQCVKVLVCFFWMLELFKKHRNQQNKRSFLTMLWQTIYNKVTGNILLTSVGLSLRKPTTVCRISSWDILIPFTTPSCSERAKNMQLPSTWLSEITKPFSWAVLFKFSDSSVWLVSLRASNWICWSVWNVLKSPVNSKITKLFPVKRCGAYKFQVSKQLIKSLIRDKNKTRTIHPKDNFPSLVEFSFLVFVLWLNKDILFKYDHCE